jgi:type II secretion system protein G
MKRNRKGFTLIELLIVVAIIGIIVAIAIPNLLNAIQRAKQRRSMGDIRSTATAVEAYAVDFNRYPPAAAVAFPTGLTYPSATVGNMSTYISPTYIRVTPLTDGWNSWFLYTADGNGQAYALVSAGRNGTTTAPVAGDPAQTTDFNSDIVYVNGQFIQYPEGVQR